MKNSNLFIDIHAIQTVPPSNINRDDTGSPKTAQYGGITRARVSSQAWKKAIRNYFNANSNDSNVGIRSLDIVRYVAEEIEKLDATISDEDAMKKANTILSGAGVKTKDNKTKALFFIGAEQAKGLAQAAVEGETDKEILKAILKNNPAVDIALFGRMLADDPSLNEDASSQVAHAISTHAVQTEFDFFTATDDLSTEDNAGAGMLGTVEFNSATLYRYANIASHELLRQLSDKEATVNAIRLFIEAFSNSMPTGKINTFANQTLPAAVMVTVRRDRPVNLVGGFESPVKTSSGFVSESINKLTTEFNNAQKFVKEPVFTLAIGIEDLGEPQESLEILLDNFTSKILPLLAVD